jgi:hypothetical protein
MDTQLSESDRASIREEVRQEVKEEMHHEARRQHVRRAFGCLAFYLVVLGVPALIMAGLAAKSGLFRVPVMTNWLYRPVTASRIVMPLQGSTDETVWKETEARAQVRPETGTAVITMSETGLTTVLRSAFLAQADALPFPVREPQAVVMPEAVELFFTTARGEMAAPVRLRFSLSASSGSLVVGIKELTVGNLSVPEALTGSVSRIVSDLLTNEFSSQLPVGTQIEKITLTEGQLSLELEMPPNL